MESNVGTDLPMRSRKTKSVFDFAFERNGGMIFLGGYSDHGHHGGCYDCGIAKLTVAFMRNTQ